MFENKKLSDIQVYNLNPQSLAFVGDAVFSLYIRQKIVITESLKANEEHRLTTNFVKASGQSQIIKEIENVLTDSEMRLYKRARNYKTNNIAKNAKVIDYKRATGFEALLGYLYLTENNDRLTELMALGYNVILSNQKKEQ